MVSSTQFQKPIVDHHTNLNSGRDVIVVPETYLPELRKLGDDVINFPQSIAEVSTVCLACSCGVLTSYARHWNSNILSSPWIPRRLYQPCMRSSLT